MMFQVGGLVKSASTSERRTLLSQAFAGEVDPVGVVDHPVEDRIGECRDADHIVPAVDRDLAGDQERAGVVAVLDDFEQISRLIGVERFGPPIVEDEQFCARDRAQKPGVTSIAMGDRQIGEQPRHAVVEDGYILPAGFLAERAGEPTLSQPARSGDEQVAALVDPVAGGEFEEQGAIEPARAVVIDILDAGRMAQAGGFGARFEAFLPAQRRFVFE